MQQRTYLRDERNGDGTATYGPLRKLAELTCAHKRVLPFPFLSDTYTRSKTSECHIIASSRVQRSGLTESAPSI